MWTFHLDELSDWALGEVYASGARFVDSNGKLKVTFLNFVDIPEDALEHTFHPSTLEIFKAWR